MRALIVSARESSQVRLRSMTVITAGSEFTETWNCVHSLLDDKLTVAVSGVYSFFPDAVAKNFRGYPLIVIESPDPTHEGKVFNDAAKERILNLSISIHALAMRSIDEVADNVNYILDSNQASTQASGLKNYQLRAGPTDHDIINRKKVHNKTLEVFYEWMG